jgi:hypothetical protein
LPHLFERIPKRFSSVFGGCFVISTDEADVDG